MSATLAPFRPSRALKTRVAQLKLRATELWRAYPRETLGFGILGVIVATAIGGVAHSRGETGETTVALPPAPPPMLIRQLAPDQALKINAAMPIAVGPNPTAQPFVFKGSKAARAQALECLASAEYYEAGNQDEDGERAVAQVVLNRVRHPAFPTSVCGVVYEGSTRPTGCQFTFTCDGSLTRQPDAVGWNRAYRIAQEALAGSVYAPVGYATHYHANYVVPYWAANMAKNAIIGAHIFYRWVGGWGQPTAFVKTYAGREPDARALRTAALAVPHITPSYQQDQLAQAIKDIPGAEPLKLAPSLRGDKRVAVRFNLEARKASEAAVPEDYAKKFEASDNLKWALSGDGFASNEKPLGKASVAAPAASTGAAGARR